MLIILFDSQGVVHKEFLPGGKRVNAEFYKGVMDRFLKRIQRVRRAEFCSRDCFLLHDNAPDHQAVSFRQFLTPKNVTTFYHPPPPVKSRFISARLFSVPHDENEVKKLHLVDVAEIQEAVTDELKKVQKKGIFGSISEIVLRTKPVYMPMELILNKRKVFIFLMCLRLNKKSFLKFWIALCMYVCVYVCVYLCMYVLYACIRKRLLIYRNFAINISV